ncbi:MAG TPA: hypothetical protein VG406_03935 [Isosphaeraceae bacterium]|jgi:hypothetical protein|nr:hypothetical protein [Isosphaeraceae bacterium]
MSRRLRQFTIRGAMIAVAIAALLAAALRSGWPGADGSYEVLKDIRVPATPPGGSGPQKTPMNYKEAYSQGRKEAEAEWKGVSANIYTYGPRNLSREDLDEETGLPYRAIAGFVVDEEIEGLADGHNGRIRELIRERGLPPGSFKAWRKELADLPGLFAARAKVRRPQRLTVGGPPLTSPDGRQTVRLVASRMLDAASGRVVEVHSLAVGDINNKNFNIITLNIYNNDIDLVWGPDDSGFAVVRNKVGSLTLYQSIDLERGRTLTKSAE